MWVDDFELARPPRGVSLVAQVGVFFGGALQTFGWAWLCLTMIFVWFFAAGSDPTEPFRFSGALEEAQGNILESSATSLSVNEQRVFAITYRFEEGGQAYEGVSYGTSPPKPGAGVKVEFVAGDPADSRIQGLRRSKVPGWVMLLLLLFPSAGLLLIIPGVLRGLRGVRLLKGGRLVTGRLVSKERTNTQINNKYVYRMTFAFQALEDERSYEVVTKTHTPEAIEDEEQERILYLPQRPEMALLLDDLPGSGQVGPQGDIQALDASPLKSLILPGLTLGGHGLVGLVFLLAQA